LPAPALAKVPLAGDAPGALLKIPSGPGVGQIVSAEGRSLVVGVTSSLRRWAASQLGLGKKPAPGRRPKLDLSAIATEIGWVEADGPFRQRLLYERLMAPLVPLSARRDLAPPVFLHLDPCQRFPRVTIRGAECGLAGLFGPFRERRAAEKARDALHRLFSLRPCDETFEPDPALPLGTACLYAQVSSCAAPCLARVSEGEYRALAERAAAWLSDPLARPGDPVLPATISAAAASRALVLDPGRTTLGLYPVRGGRVLEDAAITIATSPDELDAAVARLTWPAVEGPPDDWPWLLAWLRGPRRRQAYLLVHEDEHRGALVARLRAGLPARFGGTLGATRGEG
jgi:excinuclease ABC subunit C